MGEPAMFARTSTDSTQFDGRGAETMQIANTRYVIRAAKSRELATTYLLGARYVLRTALHGPFIRTMPSIRPPSPSCHLTVAIYWPLHCER